MGKVENKLWIDYMVNQLGKDINQEYTTRTESWLEKIMMNE